ncbi:MAG: discoidin domain-containing protein, partial [Acidobacteriota bacterium]|nr:discoidin domain-containing protein [Acidobacteriota bacterium]
MTATSSQNGNQFAGGAELRAYGVQGKSEWIDRTEWICTASDFEETGEQHSQSGHAKHACDGKISTQWHSQYNPTIAPMPHWLQVDMRVMTNVEAVGYTPRQDVYPANGIIGKYTLQYSTDGETWTDAVEGEFTDGRPAVIEVPETVQARFLRLNALSAQNGAQYAGVAEFDVKGEPVLITPIAPEFIDEDGAENDAYVIPQQDGVIYLINGNAVE